MAGVDLEPDRPHQQLTNITFRNCQYLHNSGAGFQTIANAFDNRTEPVSVLVDGAIMVENQYGLVAESFRPGLLGQVVYSTVQVRGSFAYGLVICNKAVDSLVAIRNATLQGTALPPQHWPEPWLTIGPVGIGTCGNKYRPSPADNAFSSFGGVVLEDVNVVDSVARQWLSVNSHYNANVTSTIDWSTIVAQGVEIANPNGCWVHENYINATAPFQVHCVQ